MNALELMNVLEWIGDEVTDEVQINTLRAFLFVASRGGCVQKDVEHYLKQTNATSSRSISFWTERRFDRKPGVGFIKREIDEHDQRYRNLRLTKKGQAFFEKLQKQMT